VGAYDAAAEDFAVAVGFFAVVEQQFGEALISSVGFGAAGGRPGEPS
jgi:hypothetical protein